MYPVLFFITFLLTFVTKYDRIYLINNISKEMS